MLPSGAKQRFAARVCAVRVISVRQCPAGAPEEASQQYYHATAMREAACSGGLRWEGAVVEVGMLQDIEQKAGGGMAARTDETQVMPSLHVLFCQRVAHRVPACARTVGAAASV